MSTAPSKKNQHLGPVFLISTLLTLPFAAWYGFVLSKLWAWFIVPLGVPRLVLWQAAGIYLLARFLTTDTNAQKDREPIEVLARGIAFGVLTPAMTLGCGAIYHALS